MVGENNKVVIVTGGSSGIGRCTASALKENGCIVYEFSRRSIPITIAVSWVCKVFDVDEVWLSQAPAFPFNKSGVFQLPEELRCLVVGTAQRIHDFLYRKNDIHSPLPV